MVAYIISYNNGSCSQPRKQQPCLSAVLTHDFIGLVKSYDEASGRACIEQRNFFKVGQDVEFLMPHGPVVHMTITDLTDGDGKPVEAARHAQETVYLKTAVPLEPYAMMRRKSK